MKKYKADVSVIILVLHANPGKLSFCKGEIYEEKSN